jgi:uncharacterized membrane protein
MEIYAIYYIVISSGVLLISSGVAGWNGVEISKKDFIGSIFWPIYLTTLIGLIIRIIYENIKRK